MNEHLVHDTEPTARPAAVRMRPALLIAAGVAVIGLVGFAGWFANGDTLFWSLLQAGLAWCL
jgi:hypothetical protein